MWDEIIAEVREHPKLKGKPLPEALLQAEGNQWERDAQQLKALQAFLTENGMELPEELLPFSEREKVASWLRRSAGQSRRQGKKE